MGGIKVQEWEEELLVVGGWNSEGSGNEEVVGYQALE